MLSITVKIMLFTIENNYNYFSRPISCKPLNFAIFRIYFDIFWESNGPQRGAQN